MTSLGCMLSRFSHVRLCDRMYCSLPGSSVHGILQARILEWVSLPFTRGSSWCRDWTHATHVSCIALVGGFFTTSATWDTFLLNCTMVRLGHTIPLFWVLDSSFLSVVLVTDVLSNQILLICYTSWFLLAYNQESRLVHQDSEGKVINYFSKYEKTSGQK